MHQVKEDTTHPLTTSSEKSVYMCSKIMAGGILIFLESVDWHLHTRYVSSVRALQSQSVRSNRVRISTLLNSPDIPEKECFGNRATHEELLCTLKSMGCSSILIKPTHTFNSRYTRKLSSFHLLRSMVLSLLGWTSVLFGLIKHIFVRTLVRSRGVQLFYRKSKVCIFLCVRSPWYVHVCVMWLHSIVRTLMFKKPREDTSHWHVLRFHVHSIAMTLFSSVYSSIGWVELVYGVCAMDTNWEIFVCKSSKMVTRTRTNDYYFVLETKRISNYIK